MLDAYTPTPRRLYVYLPLVCGGGGGIAAGLVSIAAHNPIDVTAALSLAGAITGAGTALLVGVNAVCNERAAWFYWQAAKEANRAQAAPAEQEEEIPLRVTRGGNIHGGGYHVIPNLAAKPRGSEKQATARRIFHQAVETARAVVDGELDGQPARLIINVTRSMWLMSQHIDRMDWRLGEKRWTEGPGHPFERTEYRALIDHMIAQHILHRPPRGNTAPAITKSFAAVMEYWKPRPCPVGGGGVAVA